MNATRTPDTETLSTRDRELVKRLRDMRCDECSPCLATWADEAADRLEALLSTRDDAPDARPDVERAMLDRLRSEGGDYGKAFNNGIRAAVAVYKSLSQPIGEVEAMREALEKIAFNNWRDQTRAKTVARAALAPKERSE